MDATAQVFVGGEFQVNSYTTDVQLYPSVAMRSDGSFVVVWMSEHQSSSNYDVFARRFSSSGVAVATEIQVNTYSSGNQSEPDVAIAASGDFVVAWQSVDGQDSSSFGIFTRRFSSAGVAQGGELQVNTYTNSRQGYPVLTFLDSGDFVVAWDSLGQDGSEYGVFAQRFTSAGAAVATEFQINSVTGGRQHNASIAPGPSGGFVVVWKGVDYGTSYAVRAQIFSGDGTPIASEIAVNTHTTNHQDGGAVAVAPSGDFLVAWSSNLQDGSYGGIFAQRFSSAGSALGSELQINNRTQRAQFHPTVASDENGNFVVAWDSEADDFETDVLARPVSATGVAEAIELQVSTYTGGTEYPRLASGAGGSFVVVWQSQYDQDGSNTGIFAQRLAILATLDIDGDGVAKPLTDGMLALRFLFGFTGNTLITGAVNTGGCTRCDAASIEAYLQTLN